MIELHFDTDEIERQMKRIKGFPWAVQEALYPAMHITIDHLRQKLAGRLEADVPLPKKLIAKSIRVLSVRASGQGCFALLNVASKAVPLIHYDVEPKEVTARKGLRNKQWPGFSYALRSGDRRQREELEGLEHMVGLPFIAQMRNSARRQSGGGHLGIYRRTPYGQLKEIYGPRVQYHATRPIVEAELLMEAEIYLVRQLTRIVDRILE